jgi:hypothetical protein
MASCPDGLAATHLLVMLAKRVVDGRERQTHVADLPSERE